MQRQHMDSSMPMERSLGIIANLARFDDLKDVLDVNYGIIG